MRTLLAIRDKRAYGWAVLVSFTINYALVVVVFMTLGLLLPDIREDLGIDVRGAGWLASSLLIANLFLEIPLNWVLSKFRPWRVATIAFLGTLAMVFLHSFSPTFTILVIARVGLGVFYLSTQPPRTLLILMWLPKKSVGLANGMLFGIMALFEGAGFILIPQINDWTGGWRETLFVWAILCAAGTLVWTIVGVDRKSLQLEPGPDPPPQYVNPLRSLLKYKEPWFLGLGLSVGIAGRLAFDTWWPTFAENTYGIEKTAAGQVLAVISVSGFPSSLGLSAIPYLVRKPALALIAAGMMLAGSYIAMLFTGSLLYLFLLALMNGFAFGFFPPDDGLLLQLARHPTERPGRCRGTRLHHYVGWRRHRTRPHRFHCRQRRKPAAGYPGVMLWAARHIPIRPVAPASPPPRGPALTS